MKSSVQVRGELGGQRSAHPLVELRCVEPASGHVVAQVLGGLVALGIADSRSLRFPHIASISPGSLFLDAIELAAEHP